MSDDPQQFDAATANGNGLALMRNGDRPLNASSREVLRSGLPAVYQESDFGMRFIGALETLLDPIIAILDTLHWHWSPDLAPDDVLDLMLGWLGVEAQEGLLREHKVALVGAAAELSRGRGTRNGLEAALRLSFPDLPLRVEDEGGVSYSLDPNDIPPAKGSDFVVYCDQPLTEERLLMVARAIDHYKPVHTRYRLRVKAARKPAQ